MIPAEVLSGNVTIETSFFVRALARAGSVYDLPLRIQSVEARTRRRCRHSSLLLRCVCVCRCVCLCLCARGRALMLTSTLRDWLQDDQLLVAKTLMRFYYD
jgi:hypothetical protein